MRNVFSYILTIALSFQSVAFAQTSATPEQSLLQNLRIAQQDLSGTALANETATQLQTYIEAGGNADQLIAAAKHELGERFSQEDAQRLADVFAGKKVLLEKVGQKVQNGGHPSRSEIREFTNAMASVSLGQTGSAADACKIVVGSAGTTIIAIALLLTFKTGQQYPEGRVNFGWPNVLVLTLGSLLLVGAMAYNGVCG